MDLQKLAAVLLMMFATCVRAFDHNDTHCNYSTYMLNYFKYYENYLLRLGEQHNRRPSIREEFSIYAQAIQTHGEIVLVMIDTLRPLNKHVWQSYDLMSVNLYLNNVSGSVEIAARDDDGKLHRNDNTANLFGGIMKMHQAIVDQLEHSIRTKCANAMYNTEFIKFVNFDKPKEYTVGHLQKVAGKLMDRIMRRIKRDRQDDNHIFEKLRFAYKKRKYLDYLPRNLLFYDLLSHQTVGNEAAVVFGSQSRQYLTTDYGLPRHGLDILHYVPLKIKCPDNTPLRMSDLFRFVKYNFNIAEVQAFQKTVMVATFYPMGRLIRIYATVVSNVIRSTIPALTYNKMITLGQTVVDNFKRFIEMNLYEKKVGAFLRKMCDLFSEMIDDFRMKKKLVDNYYPSEILKMLSVLIRNNTVDFSFGRLPHVKINLVNFNKIHDAIVQEAGLVDWYMEDLEDYVESYRVVNRTTVIFKSETQESADHGLNQQIIGYLCDKNMYNLLYKLGNLPQIGYDVLTHEKFIGVEVLDTVSNASDNQHSAERCDRKQSQKNDDTIDSTNFSKDNSSCNRPMPKYLIDYFLVV